MGVSAKSKYICLSALADGRQRFPGIDIRVEQIAPYNEVGSVELLTPAVDVDAALGSSSSPRRDSASCATRHAVKVPMALLDPV